MKKYLVPLLAISLLLSLLLSCYLYDKVAISKKLLSQMEVQLHDELARNELLVIDWFDTNKQTYWAKGHREEAEAELDQYKKAKP